MNQITSALHNAGVKLPPINKRIWLWLHDHPGKTSKEVSVALGVTHANASSQLGNMVKRRMVQGTQQKHPFRNITEWHYETSIKKFELLPVRKALKAPKTFVAPPPAFVPPVPTPEVPKPTKTPLEAIPAPLLATLEQYKLSELRLIRDGLNYLFEHV